MNNGLFLITLALSTATQPQLAFAEPVFFPPSLSVNPIKSNVHHPNVETKQITACDFGQKAAV